MNILYQEIQGSSNKPVSNFLKSMSILLPILLVFNLIWQRGTVNELTVAIFTAMIVCAIVRIFSTTRMIMQIRDEGIYVRFPPFQPSFTHFAWDDIQEIYLRKFDAVSEYYGRGIKMGPMGKGYIVSGDTGIQIVLRNNARVLISTQQPEQVRDILMDIRKVKF